MLRNYLVIALRNLWRNKLHAVINVVGLSIGISACLVIFLIVRFELGFDKFWDGGDRIYRIYSKFSGVFEATNRGVTTALPAFIRDNGIGWEQVSAFHTWGTKVQSVGADGRLTDRGDQRDLAIVDSAYFDLFANYRWLSGNPVAALGAPNQVVLTEEKARRYFDLANPADAMGRTLVYSDSLSLTVAGIVQQPVQSTDLYFNDFISFSTIRNTWLKDDFLENDWGNTNSSSQLFVRLAAGVPVSRLEEVLQQASAQYAEKNKEAGWRATYLAEPLSDLHFNTELGIFDNSRSAAHLPTLYALLLVAVLLLLIAAVNFINLETAQAARRAKEVGVRKVMGSSRGGLVVQFLGETLLLTIISVVLSIQIAEGALRYFSDFIPEGVTLQIVSFPLLSFLVVLTVVVSILAGAYPAFVLSAFRPALALKDTLAAFRGSRSATLRRGLIVFQFVVAQALIFGTLVIGSQIRFLLNKDMGFAKDAIIYFYTPWRADPGKRLVLEEELRRLPEVAELSLHGSPPAEQGYSTSVIKYDNGKELLDYNVHRKFGDTSYIHLYAIPLIAGRNLRYSDTVQELLINETLAHRLGFPDPADAVGRSLEYNNKMIPVVGVVKDFHIQSLHHAIEPTAIGMNMSSFSCFSLKIRNDGKGMAGFRTAAGKVERLWKKLYPDEPFEYKFLDETLASFYEGEQRTAKLMRTATGVAILISCLGLLGLISYSATQRTREIGIRKVLGASVLDVVALLTRDFLALALVAGAIALPLAWYGVHRWLADFAYHVDITWWMFAAATLAAVVITLVTVSFRALRAAWSNPVESLKYE